MALFVAARPASAEGATIRAISLQVRPGTPEVDPEVLRAAVAQELGTAVVPAADPPETAYTFIVSVDRERGELVVERQDEVGGVSRRVPLPAAASATLRAAVFLIGNMARDEASELLQQMSPRAPRPKPATPETIGPNPPAPVDGSEDRSIVWIGLSFGFDLVSAPSTSSACGPGAYTCVDSGESPIRYAPSSAGTSNIRGGAALANTRTLASLDFAVTSNLLLGLRGGIVGRAYGTPPIFHAEGRVTYVFGDAPLAHEGFAPLVLAAGGLSQSSAGIPVVVTENPIYGLGGAMPPPTAATAWEVGGPYFASAGVGVRWAMGSSFAWIADAKLNVAFGTGPSLMALTPLEIGAQIGL